MSINDLTAEEINACAELVQSGDPERFHAVMASPVAARGAMFVIYAFNLEVVRAPWVTQESMIAEMRLQFWRDVLEDIQQGKAPRAHHVASPLAKIVTPEIAAILDPVVAARRWDIYKDPFEDEAHFHHYIENTSASLTWALMRILGADERAETAVRAYAHGCGVARYLAAVPGLEAAGRIPLLDGRLDAVAALATTAHQQVQDNRWIRGVLGKTVSAPMLDGVVVSLALPQIMREPVRVIDGAVGVSEFSKRIKFAYFAAKRRWGRGPNSL